MRTSIDSDGADAKAEIWERGYSYWENEANFDANGEELRLLDDRQDGQLAIAQVWVYNKSGTLVDTDTFSTGSVDRFNMGTPDGSGDIPEGYEVRINICVGNITCAGTAKGRA